MELGGIEAKTKLPPFAHDIFKYIFSNDDFFIKISLKFVP